jgi:hypothetical protein
MEKKFTIQDKLNKEEKLKARKSKIIIQKLESDDKIDFRD